MFFGKPESYEWYNKRCALYKRVSTEEQARNGYSLEAQLEELEAYAKQFNMHIVGRYADEGISARKEVHRRRGLCALLESVKRNEVDYILFIKLDRWFRSVREYYKVQDILEAHNVGWKAILEDYDTTTTNGRLNLNIRLSVAQDESDRTSDRIKFVNESRVRNGGAITGSYPLALYSSCGKVHVDEEKAEIVKGIFSHYEQTGSIRNCIDYALNIHDIQLGYNTIKTMLANQLYIGKYRGEESYCSAIIEKEQFNNVRRIAVSKSKTRERSHNYVFRGLIVCPECGRKMGGWAQHDYKYGRTYLRYRCNKKWVDKNCSHKFIPWEKNIEQYLKDNIKQEIISYLENYKSQKSDSYKPKSDIGKIRRQLERLKTLYIEEIIDIDDYRKDFIRLNRQLNDTIQQEENTEKPHIINAMNAILDLDLEGVCQSFSPSEKHIVWSSIISEIVAVDRNTFRIIFLQ